MALTEHVAIVSIAPEVPTRDLLLVAAAVQKQVTRDFTPLWGIAATVDAFEDLASVPSDYRPVCCSATFPSYRANSRRASVNGGTGRSRCT